MKRVIVGGISHETSTFTPVATTLQSFHERFLLRGNEILEVLRGTNTPIGGYIDGASKHGFEIIPTLICGRAWAMVLRTPRGLAFSHADDPRGNCAR